MEGVKLNVHERTGTPKRRQVKCSGGDVGVGDCGRGRNIDEDEDNDNEEETKDDDDIWTN